MAISLAIIALAFIIIALTVAIAALKAARQAKVLATTVAELRGDLAPALKAIQAVAQDGQTIAGSVKEEATAIVATSRRLRERFEAGADRLQDRLHNLEALYDVVEEEVEETALDLAVALRTMRTGAGWFARIKRLLLRGRRR